MKMEHNVTLSEGEYIELNRRTIIKDIKERQPMFFILGFIFGCFTVLVIML